MDPLLDHLLAAAWLWLAVLGLLGALHAARSRADGRGRRRAALAVGATSLWLALVVTAAWTGAALAGRPGLVLALLGMMLAPFAALAHPGARALVAPAGPLEPPRSPPRPRQSFQESSSG